MCELLLIHINMPPAKTANISFSISYIKVDLMIWYYNIKGTVGSIVILYWGFLLISKKNRFLASTLSKIYSQSNNRKGIYK